MKKYSLATIKDMVDISVPTSQLADLVTSHTAEVESFAKEGKDTILEIKATPNRGDLLSHLGLAREIAALTDKKLNAPKTKQKINSRSKLELKIKIEDSELCPRYSALIIEGVKVGPSPKWLQERLESMGLRPINNIVDVTNYIMLLIGQPLHAFDYSKISDGKIFIRNAKEGETINSLDEGNAKYNLDQEILVITDNRAPIAIAGIKGGSGSEIDNKTVTLVIESANFDYESVNNTSRKLELVTDASFRFGRNMDPNLTVTALELVLDMLVKIKAVSNPNTRLIDVYPNKTKPWRVYATNEHVESLIGEAMPRDRLVKLLQKIGFEVKPAKNSINAVVPTWRPDVQTAEDLIEEIARLNGYDNIKAAPPKLSIYDEAQNKTSDLWDERNRREAISRIKEILKGLTFIECYNYSFVSDSTAKLFNLQNSPEIINPVSQNYRLLRNSLIPNMVMTAVNNAKLTNDLRLFEIGRIFLQKKDEVYEQERLVTLLSHNNGYVELKGVVENFLSQLGIMDAIFSESLPKDTESDWFHPGKTAGIMAGNKIVGIIGELTPLIQTKLKLKSSQPWTIFSVDISSLVQLIEDEFEMEAIPKYPTVIRDIAIVVDNSVKASQILNTINSADVEKNIVRDVDIFDIFVSEDGKKSLAFHVSYRSDDHTLTDAEVSKIETNLKNALKKRLDAQIR